MIVEALLCTQDWVIKFTNPIVDNVDDILNDDDIALGKKITIFILFLYNYYFLLNTNNIFICVYVEIAQALNMLHMDDNDMGKKPMEN